MFQSTIFFKGHLCCFASVLSDTDIGFSLVQFHRPKEWSALRRKSLVFAKESRKYHQVPHLPKVQAEDPVCLSFVICSRNRNHFYWRNPCETCGQQRRGWWCWWQSLVPTGGEAGEQRGGWVGWGAEAPIWIR